ncbi:hypothetical protein VTN77DRAFT_2992 [Rasamsonia byssochlamydoides]|uniref:uncharacterized protein n=1 Tax=Rasamsonia byssochlamydoides TaxID=89139 RepID=UPI003743AB1F
MAQYHYYSRNNNTPPPSQTTPYSSQYVAYSPHPSPDQPHQLRRVPSYVAGDDASYFDGRHGRNASDDGVRYAQGRPVGGGAYNNLTSTAQNSLGSRHSHFSAGSSQQSLPSRASSHGSSAVSGYQPYHPPVSSTSPNPSTYNPQQYTRPHSLSQPMTYNPQAYTGISNAYSNATQPHHPYNPAAYQSTSFGTYGSPNVQRQSTAASQRYGQSAATQYGPPSPEMQPPPPPPRGPDHPYGARPSTYYSDSSANPQYGYSQTHQTSSPAVPRRSSAHSQSPASPVYASGPPYQSTGSGSIPSRQHSRGSQTSSYFPTTPITAEPTSVIQENPPEPPAHLSHDDQLYGKRSSVSQSSMRGSVASPTYPTPPSSSPRRTDTLNRHPQARPLPGPPPDAEDEPSFSGARDGFGSLRRKPEEEMGYEDLMKEVEAAVMRGRPVSIRPGSGARASHIGHSEHIPDADEPAPLFSPEMSTLHLSPDEQHTHTNGSIATGTGQYVNYDAYSDESDAEAAAGLAMMQMADEEERAQAERLRNRARSGTSASVFSTYGLQTSDPLPSPPHQETGSDSDYAHYDLALYGGGYQGHMHYGDEPTPGSDQLSQDAPVHDKIVTASGSVRSSDRSTDGRADYTDEHDYPFTTEESIHPFPYPSTTSARVDTGGTGGLSEPGALPRRLSFDDGDEEGVLSMPDGEDRSGSQSPIKTEMGDLFFHPGMRPLPPAPVEPVDNANVLPHLIPAGTYPNKGQGDVEAYEQYRPLPQPSSPDSRRQSLLNPSPVPRSTSLSSHSNTPRTDPPTRSKTDADRARYKQQQEFLRQPAGTLGYNASPEPTAIALDLPTIPAGRRKKFNPAKLSSEQFRKCSEPWALSAIVAWVRELSEDETDLKEQAIIDAIVALFTHKVPTMNTADAETLGALVVKNMLAEGALVKEEEWVKFGQGTLSGVLFQITGSGCYSSRLHVQETEVFGRCYSHHCMRTLKKINLKTQMMEPEKKVQDWVTFYNVPKEVWESHPKKEIDRQNNLHEIVTTEDAYIEQLDVLRVLYRDQLATMQPPIINPKRLNKFLNDVFGKVDAVKKVNEEYLLAQLKYRQKEQGPFIVGFSDIFREWIRKAKTTYVDYAATFPHANYLVRREAERNPLFRQFLNQARDNKMSNRLSWDTYLKAPITRIQRYTLLLSTVHKNMVKDSEEKTNLAQAIEEIKVVALDCDNKVGEMTKKVDLMELASKLQLRPEMKKEVELNLEHLGRQIIFRGDLQRPGTRTRFNLVDTHAVLFDHYLVLAKAVTNRDVSKSLRYEVYDVSKLPIPMDLLVLESTNDDPVVKSSVKGISAIAPPPVAAQANSGTSTGSAGAASGKSFVPSTTIENPKDDKILYPFKVKHLGKTGTYTLFAHSIQNRQEWCEKIIEAKTKHAASLFAQNAEPFRLRVLADTAFGYSEPPGPKMVMIKGTPLDRAIREVEARYVSPDLRPSPICRAAVNCATVFEQPPGRLMCAIGTDYGVYISDYNDPRGWVRALSIVRVTQISALEEFNLLLVIADKSLIAYHLDVVCPPSGVPSQTSHHESARRAPQKLSGSREVGFFAVGHMKDRTLVFYKKRDGISSTFKVLEPVLQKSATSRTRFLPGRRQTDFFREYDEFYIPTESYNINLFHTSLAISTQRGIEVLTLDKKQPWSVPNLRSETPEAQPYLTSIANRIKDLRPLGMFRLSESEFLVAYSECAVYVNKHGDVSRSVVMEFVGRAHTACLYGRFLILFDEDFVEVRNAMNGRLRQVIPGRNVVCLDDGGNIAGTGSGAFNASSFSRSGANGQTSSTSDWARAGRTVKICMQHPEHERSQLILELIENEGQKD